MAFYLWRRADPRLNTRCCFDGSRDENGFVSLCGTAHLQELPPGGEARPPMAIRCGLCNVRERDARRWKDYGPVSPEGPG